MSLWLPVLCASLLQQQPPDDMAAVTLDGGTALLGCLPPNSVDVWWCVPPGKVKPAQAPDFEIDRHEVTRAEYARCVAHGVCRRVEPADRQGDAAPRRPVTQVTWHDARAYCGWVHKRLPTEREWEIAARGTDGRPFPWGEAPPWKSPGRFMNADTQLHDVGDFPAGASPFGVQDMAGNAEEWTLDVWGDNADACHCVVRGGRFTGDNPDPTAQTNYPNTPLMLRSYENPRLSRPMLGFRCARSSVAVPDPGDVRGAACRESPSTAESEPERLAYVRAGILKEGARVGGPLVVFSGVSLLGWGLATRAAGWSDSRWAIDSGAALAGELAGALLGVGISALMFGSHRGSPGAGPATYGVRVVEALIEAGLVATGAFGGGVAGLAIAENRSGAPPGAYVAGAGTLLLGLALPALAWVMLDEDRALPRWVVYAAMGLGVVAAVSLGVGGFAAVSH